MPGLYIHIPFCLKKCRYCDFVSFIALHESESYIHALIKEMGLAAKTNQIQFDTLFIGGGTPSVLSHGMIGLLMEHVHRSFSIKAGSEITIECNPGTIDYEKIIEYKNAGVNRISFGLQSSDDSLLARAGRVHNFMQFEEAMNFTQKVGISNINADIMAGLPGQTQRSYVETLESLKSFNLKHISAYSLILEPGTDLFNDVQAGTEKLPDEDAVWSMMDSGLAVLVRMGYSRYEISNFAIPGFECRHNINYWKNGEYLGLGISAHSAMCDPGWTRWENARSLKQYYDRIDDGKLPVINRTQIGKKEEMFESVMLGLRMTDGINLADFEQRHGVSMLCIYKNALDKLNKKGWLTQTDAGVKLTEAGLDMQNAALLEFM